jgi:hypothetical protein
MPDELDVRDDREEAHEEGGDDEVSLLRPSSNTWACFFLEFRSRMVD